MEDITPTPTTTDPGAGSAGVEDRRWRRPLHGRILGGVAAGIARHTGMEPWLVRVIFVLTSFAGGFGIAAYLVAWLLMPEDGRSEAVVDGITGNHSTGQSVGIALMAVAGLIVIGTTGLISSPLLLAAALAVVGVVLLRPSSS